MDSLRALGRRPPGRALWAGLTVALALLALCACSQITFETNDDCMIAAVAGGALTGSPHPATVYTSYLYGLLLCALYGINAALPWHGALLFALNALSLMVILYCLFAECQRKGLSGWLAVLLFGGLLAGLCLRFVVQLQFTAVSGLAFAAALTLLWCGPGDRVGCARGLAAAFLLLAGYLLRPKVALMLSPFLALLALCRGLCAQGSGRGTARFALFALGALAVLWLADGWLYAAQPGWEEYQAYDAQTTAFLDYNAYALTDGQRAAALEAAGWPDELFDLAKNWYFLDDRINTQSLTALNAALEAATPAQPFFRRLGQALYAAASVLRRYPMFGWNSLAYGLAACAALAVAARQRNASALLWMVGSFGLALALIVVFYGFLGRFPLRLAFPVAAALYIPLLPCFASLLPPAAARSASARCVWAGLAALLLLGNLTAFALGGRQAITPQNDFSISRYNDGNLREVASYAAAHPDTVYVTDISLDFLPFTVFPPGAFRNVIFWSSGIHSSPAAQAQLRALGYERLNADSFFDGNIRLLLTRSPGVREGLESYLQRDYGAIELQPEEETEAFAIYRAIR